MATENETIESLTQKLKEYEEKNNELINKVNELNIFIQKQNIYIKTLKDQLNEKELIILQQQRNGDEKNHKDSLKSPKSPKTPLTINIPNYGKVSYKYSKISSPITDVSYASFSQLSPIIHVEHIRHSSTEDNITTIAEPKRKPSYTSRLKNESKLMSASDNNIIYNPNISTESLSKPQIKINDDDINSSINDFEDKEILSDEITVYILKIQLSKNDKNKKDISFIISIRNADSGDELWKIEKTYTDIVNLENNV
ncbi:hypothetical protein PIROE2DRAFT_8032 [Piromyces sp. E2]|nr:hypothetical protein PIROE2DRAFT_8032 [Piromyces sp. E2]|eukprot:OUM65055.1 hypothetical protein PIROE2DRAFT_8032 [Piromyces sp. E2]